MTFAILLAAVALAAVAAAGILRPFGRARHATLERLADPLEDERRSLLRALRDLEDERTTGGLTEETYQLLRFETETRAVAVLRALEAREGSDEVGAGLRELRDVRPVRSSNGDAAPAASPRRSRGRTMAVAAVGVALVGALVPILAHAVSGRAAGTPITGALPSPSGASDPLAFFEQRVRRHPRDLAARLDLGQRYLEAGKVQAAIGQYETALSIDPRDPEAKATLGFLIFAGGRPAEGLRVVQEALATNPTFPEALYFEGVIYLQGLHDEGRATRAFRAYLRAAPFGSHVAQVRRFLAGATPGPTPSG